MVIVVDNMKEENRAIYILVYFFEFISGIIGYFFAGENERLRFHSKQAMILGVISFIISFIPIVSVLTVFIWLYGLYLGIKAYKGKDVGLPIITSKIEEEAVESEHTSRKKVTHSKVAESTGEHIKALKLRYAKGEITKKEYNKIKKDLE